jgi:hypothetical protein
VTVRILGPFSPPIVPFRPSFVRFKNSDIHGAGSSASAHHCLTLVIVCGSLIYVFLLFLEPSCTMIKATSGHPKRN